MFDSLRQASLGIYVQEPSPFRGTETRASCVAPQLCARHVRQAAEPHSSRNGRAG